MARTTEEIIEVMDAEQAAQPSLSDLNSTSQTSIYKLWKYVIAMCQRVLELLWDAKQEEMENVLAQGGVGSTEWVRRRCFEFQYDSVTPQIMQLIDGVPQYPIVDESKRIITYVVVRNNLGVADILAAKGNPPTKLSSAEITALQDYFTDTGSSAGLGVGLGFVGQALSVNSLDPDEMYIEGVIYYAGKYSNVIQNNVIIAIENYLADLQPSGVFYVQKLYDAIQAVEGVSDILISNLQIRTAAQTFGNGTDVIQAGLTATRLYSAAAGYIIGETTTGETMTDKLSFSAV